MPSGPTTIFGRLLRVGGAVIVLVSAAWYGAATFLWTRTNTAAEIRETSRELQQEVLEARRAEKDFLLRDLRTPEFHRHGESPNVRRHASAMGRVREHLEALAKLGGAAKAHDLAALRRLVDQTEAPFAQLVTAQREKGFMDWGLEGEWRRAAHDIEGHLARLDRSPLQRDLLQLRRYEKDYLLRRDDKALAGLTTTLANLRARLQSLRGAEALLADLDVYAAAFQRYLAVDRAIGMTEDLGLQGELRRAAHAIDPLVDKLAEEAARNSERARREFLLASGVIFLATLALGGGLFSVVARSITRPLTRLTEAVVAIGQGRLDTRLDFPSSDEVGVLAHTVNGMAASLKRMIAEIQAGLERELHVARDIQRSLLPHVFPPYPDRPEFDVFALIAPARDVGGDFYDFFFVDDDHFCVAVGDVSGKGIPASLFMAVTKTLLKATAGRASHPARILAALNRELCRDNDACMFVTLFCGVLDLRTGALEYSNGGHNRPYRMRVGEVVPLPATAGVALGITEQATYQSATATLAPGDRLLLYTDGVTEAMNPHGEQFAEHRLHAALANATGAPLRDLAGLVVDQVRRFAGDAPQSDDLTALVLEYAGPAHRLRQDVAFRLANRLSELPTVHRHLEDMAAREGWPPKVAHDLMLALEEVITNIVSHAYTDGGEHAIRVRVLPRPDAVTVEVEDDGPAFDPLAVPPPDVTMPLADRPIGGLGIQLVRALMDGLEYRRRGDTNLLILRKKTRG